jgi:hypothetical protein
MDGAIIMIKKLIIAIFIILFAGNSFATTALYRTSSGEVVAISESDSMFVERTATGYWSVAVDPVFADGKVLRDSAGELRVLGFAKIHDSGTVRDATQPEIDAFVSLRVDDRNQIKADKAKAELVNNSVLRMLVKALSEILADEFNTHKQLHDDVLQAAADATSLADFKTRMGNIGTVPTRSKSALFNAIKDEISKDD